MERVLRAEPGALGFTATNDSIVYLLVWFEVAAALAPAAVYVLREDLSTPSAPAAKGPLDRFRVGAAYAFAALVTAFTFAYQNDPDEAIPGLRTRESLWLFGVANALSAAAFASLCAAEARASAPESTGLRFFWWFQVRLLFFFFTPLPPLLLTGDRLTAACAPSPPAARCASSSLGGRLGVLRRSAA